MSGNKTVLWYLICVYTVHVGGQSGSETAHLDQADHDVTLCHGGHLGYQIRLPLAIQNRRCCLKNSKLPPRPPSWILELNDLAILNLHVTLMPPIRFRLNLTYHLGGDVV